MSKWKQISSLVRSKGLVPFSVSMSTPHSSQICISRSYTLSFASLFGRFLKSFFVYIFRHNCPFPTQNLCSSDSESVIGKTKFRRQNLAVFTFLADVNYVFSSFELIKTVIICWRLPPVNYQLRRKARDDNREKIETVELFT